MAELKTRANESSVSEFLSAVEDPRRREECREVLAMMRDITGKRPRMWGTGMVGFGTYHYRYASGREGDWPVTAFAPRKRDLTIYVMPGFSRYAGLMEKLGKYRTGVSCLYLKRLDDVDRAVLRELVARSVEDMREMYTCR